MDNLLPMRMPRGPRSRRPIHSRNSEVNNYLNTSWESHMKRASLRQQKLISERDALPSDNSENDRQINDHNVLDKETICLIPKLGVITVTLIFLLFTKLFNITSENQTEFNKKENPRSFKAVEDPSAKFHNEDLHIFDEISSGKDEVKVRRPTVPLIILLFTNETYIMDCMGSALAYFNSEVLSDNTPLCLNMNNFGKDSS